MDRCSWFMRGRRWMSSWSAGCRTPDRFERTARNLVMIAIKRSANRLVMIFGEMV
jgi:hypothetical protein